MVNAEAEAFFLSTVKTADVSQGELVERVNVNQKKCDMYPKSHG